jgi:hypothetical protein
MNVPNIFMLTATSYIFIFNKVINICAPLLPLISLLICLPSPIPLRHLRDLIFKLKIENKIRLLILTATKHPTKYVKQ